MIANDMALNAALTASTWKACVVIPRGPTPKAPWNVPTGIITKSIAGLCEQAYLINVFYKMSKNLPLTIILGILALSHVGCHLAAAGYILTNALGPTQLVGKTMNVYATKAAWSLGAVTDILVAIGVLWQLVRLNVVLTAAKGITRKFVVCIVVSGSLTGMCGILLLILLSTNQYAFLILASTFAKIYGITVFANFAFIQDTWEPSMAPDRTRDIGSTIRGWFGTGPSIGTSSGRTR